MRRENLRPLVGFLVFGAAAFGLSVVQRAKDSQCVPTVVERGGPTRSLPHSFYDQADESRRRMHPWSRVLQSRRSSSIGDIDYALLVFDRSSGDWVEITALAVDHATSRVWAFEAECAPDAWRNGVQRTLLAIARLPDR